MTGMGSNGTSVKGEGKMKKALLYLLSVAIVEAVLVAVFLIVVAENGFDWSVWKYFGWVQIPVPVVSLVFFAFILVAKDKEEEATRKSEWIGRVNKMLEEYEKEKQE